jgi:hypothetical protein
MIVKRPLDPMQQHDNHYTRRRCRDLPRLEDTQVFQDEQTDEVDPCGSQQLVFPSTILAEISASAASSQDPSV